MLPSKEIQLALAAALDRFAVREGVVLVAVSGGADSMALLHLLRQIAPSRGLHLVVAHLNHGLRGAASDGDQAFVADYCRTHDLTLRTQTVPIRELAEGKKTNLEAEARRRRYAWLIEQAQAVDARWIATAHHADDQAETVLHHLLRGTHLAGLRGIAPRRKLTQSLWLIRPLLGVGGAEIEAWLNQQAVPFRIDASNADLRLTRNFLRHEILARLKARLGDQALRPFLEMAEKARSKHQRLARAAREVLKKAERPRVEADVILAAAPLAEASIAVARAVFVRIWRREGWPRGAMTRRQWTRLARLARLSGGALDMPGGIRARRKGQVLQLRPAVGEPAA